VLEIIRPGVLGKAKLVGFWGFLHEVGLSQNKVITIILTEIFAGAFKFLSR